MSEVNYTKFKDSLSRLQERYAYYLATKDEIARDIDITESIKESCIQRFEICFDTSWKHLKKYLEHDLGLVDVKNSPNPIFRQAFENKLIQDPELWIEFNKKRGDTTHDYNGSKAEQAFDIIGDFIAEAIDLYEVISGKLWQR
jgi:nucleotidyltransferase substrate binding protein (TIGR01987 family)